MPFISRQLEKELRKYLFKVLRSCIWRNYNQSKVDYLEVSGGKISAWEMKWNKPAPGNFNRAFRNLYPDAQTAFLSPSSIGDFAGILSAR